LLAAAGQPQSRGRTEARSRACARRAGLGTQQESFAISTNFRHNEQIRISPIFLIDQNDVKVGPTSTAEAMRKARESGMDLVEVAPNARPPVCKIMDYGKWRYQQQKKEDKSRAANKGGRLKMLNVDTVRIGEHDLEIKINKARDFLEEGNKVQFTLRFKGREMAHQDLGYNLFRRIKTELWQVSKVERDAKMEGKRMTLVLQPDHKAPGAKPPVFAAAPARGPVGAGSGLNISRPTGAPVGGAVGSAVGGPPRPGINPTGPGIARPAAAAGPGAPGVTPPRPAPAAPAQRPAAAAPVAPPTPAPVGSGS
jgi:translation initiation factor IF-3